MAISDVLAAIEPAFERTRMFRPLRNAYLRSFKGDYWNEFVIGPQLFYRQFVSRGSTVFDIGANVGTYTEAFLSLGAGKVVAVEPTPDLVRKLRYIRDKRLTVVGSGVGKEPGILPFNLSNFSTLNSFSGEWLDKVAQEVPSGRPQWVNTVNVEVTTLDAIIKEHGTPDYIKIDVEGAELQVLQGLTSSPKYLSFEFHSELHDILISCIRRSCFSPLAQFNYILGEPCGKNSLMLSEWVGADGMVEIARNALTTPRVYGDIFVREAQSMDDPDPVKS
jgi:FkbM family methyltransferase